MQQRANTVTRGAVIGLDGADFRYILPLVRRGRLPVLQRLLAEGVAGPSRSTELPVTGVAWPVLFTGKNPAKTGIVAHAFPASSDPGGWVSDHAQGIRTEALWNMLNRQGLRVGLLNLPMTHKLPLLDGVPVKGFWVPGFDAPEGPLRCHPSGLLEELFGPGSYPLVRMQHDICTGRHTGIGCYRTLLSAHAEALQLLQARQPCDVLMTNVQLTDFIGHRTSSKAQVEQVYCAVDEWLGCVLDLVAEDAVVAVVSDHGFAPARYRVGMRGLLQRLGLARFTAGSVDEDLFEKASAAFGGPLGWAARVARRSWRPLPGALRGLASRALSRLLPQLRAATGKYVWNATRIFTTGWGTLFVHRDDRFPGAPVPAGRASTELASAVQALMRVPAADGEPLFEVVYPRRQWDGPFLALAPDAIATLRPEGYVLGAATRTGRTVEAWDRDCGCHAPNGVFVMKGGGLRSEAWAENLELRDLVPNFLAALGLEVPPGVDKGPRNDLFRHRVPEGESSGIGDWRPHEQGEFTEGLDEQVASRLRGLGYM